MSSVVERTLPRWIREAKELVVSNDALGDLERLKRSIDEQGYLFFRDVLDKDALGAIRSTWMDFLAAAGAVDEGAVEPVWTGKPVENSEQLSSVLDEAVRRFVSLPATRAFYEGLIGVPVSWMPNPAYRATVPSLDKPERLVNPHQDGFSIGDVEGFSTTWIPLMDIDLRTGGLLIAERMHKGGYLHDLTQPPTYPLPISAIPEDAWRRADYRLGDVAVFDRRTPHTGLVNLSDRIRLSIDTRFLPQSVAEVILGDVSDIRAGVLTLLTDDGRTVSLRFDDETFFSLGSRERIPTSEVAARMPVGKRLYALHKDGRVTHAKASADKRLKTTI